MADIPSQLSFEHMLSHTFPGLFAALSIFMIIDIQSPFHIGRLISADINTLISFYGILLLGGTILGVIIDGLHHLVIEQTYFERILGKKLDIGTSIVDFYKKKNKCENGTCGLLPCEFINYDIKTTTKIYFLFKSANLEKYIALREYLTKSVYYYSEFYSNTFIALIPFMFIAPIYLVKKLHVGLYTSIGSGILLVFLAIVCLDSAWKAYQRWMYALYFAFCKCPKTPET